METRRAEKGKYKVQRRDFYAGKKQESGIRGAYIL